MAGREYVVLAVNRHKRLVVCEDDTIGWIENLYDCDGEETNDVDDACGCIVRMPDGYLSLDLRQFKTQALN